MSCSAKSSKRIIAATRENGSKSLLSGSAAYVFCSVINDHLLEIWLNLAYCFFSRNTLYYIIVVGNTVASLLHIME